MVDVAHCESVRGELSLLEILPFHIKLHIFIKTYLTVHMKV